MKEIKEGLARRPKGKSNFGFAQSLLHVYFCYFLYFRGTIKNLRDNKINI